MVAKKIHENPIPDDLQLPDTDVPKDPPKAKETTTVPMPSSIESSPKFSMMSFTKIPPNELYRKVLPAVLFLLTFVTVMTMLLIYMDTVALGAQQFRLNMSRDYELSNIPQDSPSLVAFVREWRLAPPTPHVSTEKPVYTEKIKALDAILGEKYNGTFVEFLPRGGRDAGTLYLSVRGWRGLAVRAAPRDYLALGHGALHACMSPGTHPREVTYDEEGFKSRVLCLPLYTVLIAGEAENADYTILAGPNVFTQLQNLPFNLVNLKVLEIRSRDEQYLEKITKFLQQHKYRVAEKFENSIMYALND